MKKIVDLKFTLFLFLIGFNYYNTHAQSADTIYTYAEYLRNIIEYHPVAKKANLKLQFAQAEKLAAKGNLDPEIFSDWNQKEFCLFQCFPNSVQYHLASIVHQSKLGFLLDSWQSLHGPHKDATLHHWFCVRLPSCRWP